MVEIPHAVFEGKSATPCNSATPPPANKMTEDKKAQEKPSLC